MTLFDQIQLDKANSLLEGLNDGLREKEKYQPVAHYTEKGFEVFICANREKDMLFNVLDFEGNIPNGFSANWRTIHHINIELNLKLGK